MAPKANSWDANTWEELKERTTLEEVLKALKAKEVQRIAHKKHYLNKQIQTQIGKAIQDGMSAEEAIKSVKS